MLPETADLDAMNRSMTRVPLWAAYLAVGALLLVVHAVLETGSLPQSLLYDVIGGSAVAVALVGVWRNRPDRRLPWVLMAIGQASFVAGDLLWNWYEVIGEDPFPSLADVLYLAGYPFIAAGLLLLIRRRVGDGDRGGLLDAAILTTAAGHPVVDVPHPATADRHASSTRCRWPSAWPTRSPT